MLASMVERRIGELFSDLDQLELASAPFKRSPDNGSALSVLLKDLADEKLNYRDYSMTVVDKLLNCDLIQSKEDKNLASSLEVFYKTVIVLYMSYLPRHQVELYHTTEKLLESYPEFSFDSNCENDLWYDLMKDAIRMRKKKVVRNVEEELMNQHTEEMERLLIFRNFMRLCLVVIPPEGNKNILLKVVAKLEGAGQSYITGGDPRPATRRRIKIYEKESGIKAKRKSANNSAGPFPPSTGSSFDSLSSATMSSSLNGGSYNNNTSLILLPSNGADLGGVSPLSSSAAYSSSSSSSTGHISLMGPSSSGLLSGLPLDLYGGNPTFSSYASPLLPPHDSFSSILLADAMTTASVGQTHCFQPDAEEPSTKKIKIEPQYSILPCHRLGSGPVVIDLDDIVIPDAPFLECSNYV